MQIIKKRIEFSAFNDCSSLELITFKSNSKLTTIESYAFENCLALWTIKIPPSVLYIRRFAFKDCKSLNEIVINPSIQIIQPNAFDGCTSLDVNLIPSSAQNTKIPFTENPRTMKVVFLGDTAVGKTCILKRYTENIFWNEALATVGVDFETKIADIDGNQVKPFDGAVRYFNEIIESNDIFPIIFLGNKCDLVLIIIRLQN